MSGERPSVLVVLGVVLLVAGLVGLWVSLAGGEPRRADDGFERREARRFSFDYPGGWHRVEGVDFPLAEPIGTKGIGDHTFGLDLENWVTVYHADAQVQIDETNVAALLGPARSLVRDVLAKGPGVEVLRNPFQVGRAGLAGLRYRLALSGQSGNRVEASVTSLYKGRDTYIVACQARPAHLEEITAGCERVTESLRPGLEIDPR